MSDFKLGRTRCMSCSTACKAACRCQGQLQLEWGHLLEQAGGTEWAWESFCPPLVPAKLPGCIAGESLPQVAAGHEFAG